MGICLRRLNEKKARTRRLNRNRYDETMEEKDLSAELVLFVLGKGPSIKLDDGKLIRVP